MVSEYMPQKEGPEAFWERHGYKVTQAEHLSSPGQIALSLPLEVGSMPVGRALLR